MEADPIAMLKVADALRDIGSTLLDAARAVERIEMQVPLDDYLYRVAKLEPASAHLRTVWAREIGLYAEAGAGIVDGLVKAAAALQAADQAAADQVAGV
jgi:hypothetical protein